MSVQLNLDSWYGACPVVLPLGASTISSVYTGSIGILVPFIFFVLAMFSFLHTMWLNNTYGSETPSKDMDSMNTNDSDSRCVDGSAQVFFLGDPNPNAYYNTKRSSIFNVSYRN